LKRNHSLQTMLN